MLAHDGTHQHLGDRWALRRRGARNMADAPAAAAAGKAAVDTSDAPAQRCDDGLRRALRQQAVAAGPATPHDGGHWRAFTLLDGAVSGDLSRWLQTAQET